MNQNQEKISLKYLFDTSPYKDYHLICTGLSGSEKAYFVNRLYLKHRAPVVVITPSAKEAEIYLEDIDFFSQKPSPPLIYFPPYNITPFKYLSYHNETAANRIRALYRLIVDDVPPMVVTTISALMQRLLPKQELCDYAELIMTDEDIDRDRLAEKLISGGYERSSMVEEPGDFSIRGGILDNSIFFSSHPANHQKHFRSHHTSGQGNNSQINPPNPGHQSNKKAIISLEHPCNQNKRLDSSNQKRRRFPWN